MCATGDIADHAAVATRTGQLWCAGFLRGRFYDGIFTAAINERSRSFGIGLQRIFCINGSRLREFIKTLTTKMLTYAVGRGVTPFDMPSVRKIIRESGPKRQWSSLVLAVVKSMPFQMNRTTGQSAATVAP